MSTPPFSQFIFDTDEPIGFDSFTPHLRILSLGGIRVDAGGWTAGELSHRLRSVAEKQAIAVDERGGYAQLTVQLNALRISYLSSLLGLTEARLGLILLDARLGEDWFEQSLRSASQELKIWYEAHQSLQNTPKLKCWIWVELPNLEVSPQISKVKIERGFNQLSRIIQLYHAELISEAHGSAISLPNDTQCLWNMITEPLDDLARDSQFWSEARSCIDGFSPLIAGNYYQGGGRLSPNTERPQHRVKITQNLWVSQGPITRGLWALVMGEEIRRDEDDEDIDHSALLPVTHVSWFDALRFCNRLSKFEELEPAYEIEDHELPIVKWIPNRNGYRLLTESEWEYACRGRVVNSVTAQASLNFLGWTADRARLRCHPIAQLSPNGWGLYDCIGNVAEWCQDSYLADVYQKRSGERLSVDPCEYDVTVSDRVIRGGAFDTEPYLATPSRRDSCSPRLAWSSIGLRVARPILFDSKLV